MENQHFYEISLHFSHYVVSRIFLHYLESARGASPKNFAPRIIQSLSPFIFDMTWSNSQISLQDDTFHLSTQIEGSTHLEKGGASFFLDGPVDAYVQPVIIADAEGHPYVRCKEPQIGDIDTRHISFLPEKSKNDTLTATSQELEVRFWLNAVLTRQLMQPLAALPLTYTLSSLPLQMASMADSHGIAVEKTCVHIVGNEGLSLLVGFQLQTPSAPPAVHSLLDTSKYNTALGISNQGMKTLLAWLNAHDQCRGTIDDEDAGHLSWTLISPNITFLDNWIHLQGDIAWTQSIQTGVVTQPFRRAIDVFLQQRSDDEGNMYVTLDPSSNLDPLAATIITAAWSTILQQLLHMPPKSTLSSPGQSRLYQRFSLPGIQADVETFAREIVVQHDQLLVYYDLPVEETASRPPIISGRTLGSAAAAASTVAAAAGGLYSLANRPAPPTPPPLQAQPPVSVSQQKSPSPRMVAGTALTAGKVATALVLAVVIVVIGTIVNTAVISFQATRSAPGVVSSPAPAVVPGQATAVLPSSTPTNTVQNYTIHVNVNGENFDLGVENGKIMSYNGNSCVDGNGFSIKDRRYMIVGTQKPEGESFKSTFACTGTYQNGTFSFTVTVTQDELDSALDPNQNCVAKTPLPYTYVDMSGQTNGSTITINEYHWQFPSWDCGQAIGLQTGMDNYFQTQNLPLSMENGSNGLQQGNQTVKGRVAPAK